MTRNFWSAPALALAAGLVLLVTGAADWVTASEARNVGDIVVREPTATPGTVFAPLAVAFGLAGLAGGVLLAVARAAVRRVVGAVVAAVGAAGLAVVVVGALAARDAQGQITPAPFFAMAAAAGVAVAGLAALQGVKAPPTASRYRVADERPGDDEWALADADDPPPS